jgi:rhamnose utilization protein RhaD (predicted bifunctional aldolase and dehydrogenase)
MADNLYSKLEPLLQLTRTLGQPTLNYVIIGEGNTSCRIDADSFWIKASGQQMNNIEAEGFAAVQFQPILEMLKQPELSADAQKAIVNAARLDASMRLPSIEVSFHALLLADCDVNYIGHTHPIAVNRIMCSSWAETYAARRMFPDEVVLCGPESVYVPYTDPGLPLALAIRDRTQQYMEKYGEPPKVILMQNHGLIALGQTPSEILNVTAMAVKAAEIFAGACAIGEPIFLSEADIHHLYRRPDEIFRRQQFVEKHTS